MSNWKNFDPKLVRRAPTVLVIGGIWALIALSPSMNASTLLPRTIIALLAEEHRGEIVHSNIHQYAEIVLNHLGFKLEYHSIGERLPNLSTRPDVYGVISWLPSGTRLKKPQAYLKWASAVVRDGKKYVIMGAPGFSTSASGVQTPRHKINEFLGQLGLEYQSQWKKITYNIEVTLKNMQLFNFESALPLMLEPFEAIGFAGSSLVPHLLFQEKDAVATPLVLVATGPNGGYVAEGYAVRSLGEFAQSQDLKSWILNPFEFFRLAFLSDLLPKPDTTTIAGRRIYYSHIDGDGFNNVSQIEDSEKKGRKSLSSERILEAAILPFTDLPVTVSIIAADIDPNWAAGPRSREVAREIFRNPQVEAGSHTYSHPFIWGAFNGAQPAKEKTVSLARAFHKKPFDINREIAGSIRAIEELLPKGKKVKVLMWTGNTLPFEAVIKATRDLGVGNINGGDSRFDKEFPSIAWVAPLGRQVGAERQVYASTSNENTYTNLWRDRFFGFKYLVETLKNTESPVRLKPLHVYYHMYSGERKASLKALLDNLEFARTQTIAPISTHLFTQIVDGFNSAQIYAFGANKWQIRNRGALQTIRFDNYEKYGVDFKRSVGVIGQKHFQKSLYVYLDASREKPSIVLIKKSVEYSRARPEQISLRDSRWRVWGLRRGKDKIAFWVQGFGLGEMNWSVPKDGRYLLKIDPSMAPSVSYHHAVNGVLKVSLGQDAIDPFQVEITRLPQ